MAEQVATRNITPHTRDSQNIEPPPLDNDLAKTSPPITHNQIDPLRHPLTFRKSISRKQIGSHRSRTSAGSARSEVYHLQRLVLRMDRASQETVLLRIREVWMESIDETIQGEIELEKLLWVLSAFHIHCSLPTLRVPPTSRSSEPTSSRENPGNLLELAHGIGKSTP